MADALAVLTVLVAAPLNWLVTIRLWRLSLAHSGIRVLRERAIVSLVLAFLVTVFALVFLNNDIVPPPLAFESTKLITRGAMLAAGIIPAVYWLWLYR